MIGAKSFPLIALTFSVVVTGNLGKQNCVNIYIYIYIYKRVGTCVCDLLNLIYRQLSKINA